MCNVQYMNSDIEFVEKKYVKLCNTKSDIYEHLPLLRNYSSKCESVIECGVRRCVSSWALIHGLLNNNMNVKKIIFNDIIPCDVKEIVKNTKHLNIEINYIWCSDTEMQLDTNYDLVFIDTWHVYGQLKRELNKFGKVINKYIIMHDTSIDEIHSESVRNKHDIHKKMEEYNFTYDEVTVGLKRAIDEFLLENPEWVVLEKLTNNNGITVLEKMV